MQILKSILFIPLSFLFIGAIYLIFDKSISFILGLEPFWIFCLIFLFGSVIWSAFTIFSSLFSFAISLLSPNRRFAFWIVLIFTFLNAYFSLRNIWTMFKDYGTIEIFISIAVTFLIIQLTAMLTFSTSE